MKILILVLIGMIVIAATNGSVYAQAIPSTDPYVDRQCDMTALICTEVYDDSGIIRFQSYNPSTRELIVQRLATSAEVTSYTFKRKTLVREAGVNSLKGGVSGSKWETWVQNRSDELSSCESDMATIGSVNFNSLGLTTQNQIIQGLATCVELNSRINRITINSILKILQERGLDE